MRKRTGGKALAVALLCCASVAVAQSGYPLKVVRIIVPTATGGPGDNIARQIAQGLSERLGRQVVVENRIGAGTMIGSELVAKAPADGHTLLVGLSTLATNPTAYKKVPYDAVKDFAPITQALSMANLMVTHPTLPARNVRELIALARARPGEILYGSSGIGTNPHLTIELFSNMAGIKFTHVPYKSSTSIIDLVAGQIALSTSPLLLSLPHARAGRLRMLGVTSANRVATAPDIPTISESGLPGFDSVQWYGMLAPAGTPRDIIERLHRETVAILRAPEVRTRLSGEGADVVAGTPEEFSALLRREIDKWARVAKAAGIVPE